MIRSSDMAGGPSANVQRAMDLLLEAHATAVRQKTDVWQYALEINDLRRAGALDHEVRMLIGMGWIEHALEVTGRKEQTRRFRPTRGLALQECSCAIVTPRGIVEAAAAGGTVRMLSLHEAKTSDRSPMHLKPVWDRMRRQLRVNRHVAKQLHREALAQEAILEAFQIRGWPSRIADPLPHEPETETKRRLNQTLKNLNRGQKMPAVHFEGDGTGTGICWSLRLV